MSRRRRMAGITAGDLAEQLMVFKDYELYIGDLEFFRVKVRGPKTLAIEFSQTVYRNSKGKIVVEEHD